MERIKRWARRAFVRPVWQSLLIAGLSWWLLIWALTHPTWAAVDYIAYLSSIYGLVVAVTAGMRVVPWVRAWLTKIGAVEWYRTSPGALKLRQDADFRGQVGMWAAIACNAGWGLIKLLAGRALGSLWLISLGIYNLLLALLRLMLMLPNLSKRPERERDWRRYRACGAALLVMNIALLIMVFQLILRTGGFHYPGALIYLMAIYAFWALINATVALVKSHRRAQPLPAASNAIALTAALVSMLALETALIQRFGDAPVFHRFMVAITGGAVCAFELALALYMIDRAKKELAP